MKGLNVIPVGSGLHIITKDGTPIEGHILDIKFWEKQHNDGGRVSYALTGKITAHIEVPGMGEFYDVPVRLLRAA